MRGTMLERLYRTLAWTPAAPSPAPAPPTRARVSHVTPVVSLMLVGNLFPPTQEQTPEPSLMPVPWPTPGAPPTPAAPMQVPAPMPE